MEDNNLLDEQELGTNKDRTLEMVAWWEKKRIVYNLVLLIVGVFGLLFLYYVSGYHKEYKPIYSAAIGAIFYGIIANICYTIGWIIEVFIRFYLKYEIPSTFRIIIFTLGLVFSVLVTIAWIVMFHSISPH